ncbi:MULTISPECIES: formylglycine-generating enzyme family protein [unclassified Enterococcus]|uniref:formylglycine-generating enzyme family protein n=1 Tax=unclassified Enterococcus TaxID=2608891 RepID=UPI001A9BA96E|nr:formylglycine-generating enzyme family protein [Enterococcus sp. DIV1271a]MBO1300333.1 formylglycine-generating enzyme family protein [Enterococcus sp. DIV1271a]
MIKIPGGSYNVGTNHVDGFEADHEGPRLSVIVPTFWMDETTVTNAEFAKFIEGTGYVTEAERFGWSFVFHYFLSEQTRMKSQLVSNMVSWYAVAGADWRHPEGPDSTIEMRMDHPVVQVSRNDAIAYCKWAGKRLPSEMEWEIAAKGGTNNERYPWGDEEFILAGKHRANIWQGDFPHTNTKDDGFTNTAPAKWYEPNGLGMYQAIGNVWEWCSNPARVDLKKFQTTTSEEIWQAYQQVDDNFYATRGGSFLCHYSYCKRYRIAARNGNSGMSAANNLGFRCVK